MNLASVIDKKLANSLFLIHVREDGTSHKYSYRELDQKSSWFARSLVTRGIKQEECIGILSNNSFEYIVAYYGALKAGVVAVLINNKMTKEEIDAILKYVDDYTPPAATAGAADQGTRHTAQGRQGSDRRTTQGFSTADRA